MRLLLAALLVIGAWACCTQGADSDGSEIDALDSDLFDASRRPRPPLDPNETLKHLERLKKLLEAESTTSSNEKTGKMLKTVTDLIETSRPTDDKCNNNYFLWLESERADKNKFAFTIKPYLKYRTQVLYAHCGTKIIKAAATLKMSGLLERLGDIVRVAAKKTLYARNLVPDGKSLDLGVFRYLKSRTWLSSKMTEEQFNERYREYVGKFCEQVNKVLEPWTKFYRRYIDTDFVELVDKRAIKWAANDEICSLARLGMARNQVYDLFKASVREQEATQRPDEANTNGSRASTSSSG